MKISMGTTLAMATLLAASPLVGQTTTRTTPPTRTGATPPATAAAQQPQQGQGFTFDFQQQEVTTVLYAIAEAGKINLTVTGVPSTKRISLRVLEPLKTKAQFVAAIKGIAEDNDLIYNESETLIRVAGKPQPVVPTQQQAQQAAQAAQAAALAEANKQSVHSYQLKHVSAATLAPVLTALFQSQGGGRGGVTTQPQTNNNAGRGGAAGGAAGRAGGAAGGTAGGGRGGGGGGDLLSLGYDVVNPTGTASMLANGNTLDTLYTLDQMGNLVIDQVRGATTMAPATSFTVQGNAAAQNPLQALQGLFGVQGGGGANQQVLPPRIIGETVSNQLLILANDEDWAKIQQVLQSVDLRPLQVLIEVTIAEVSRSNDLNVGVSGRLAHKSGNQADTMSRAAPDLTTARDFITKLVGSSGAVDYSVALNALQPRGDLKVLSLPIVIAQNNLQATLNVGQRLPFPSTTQSVVTGGVPSVQTTYQYVDVATTLTITPTINRDGYVNMVVAQADNNATTDPTNGQYIINTREATTNVFLRDGQTTVIGGLTGKSSSKTTSGIPILSSIPFIGPLLFGSRTNVDKTSELFLFLTPHIISTDVDVDTFRDAIRSGSDLLKDVPVGGRIVPGDTAKKAATPPTGGRGGGGNERSFR